MYNQNNNQMNQMQQENRPSYQVPVSNTTIDSMFDMLIREKQRLTQENQQLREQLQNQDNNNANKNDYSAQIDSFMR